MVMIRRTVAAAAVAALLWGCAYNEEGLNAPRANEVNAVQDSGVEATPASAPGTAAQNGEADSSEAGSDGEEIRHRAGMPELGTTRFEPQDIPSFEPTDTFVGGKVEELREDLGRLQQEIGTHNERLQDLRREARQAAVNYHDLLAAMNARLQVGTTPGNPELVQQWNQAQVELQRVDQIASRMNELANDASGTSALAAFLLDSVGASYGLSGAIERDHEHLAVLEDSTNRTVVLIDRLLNELSEDVARQNGYLSRERANLSVLSLAIKNGEVYGDSLGNRAYGRPDPTPEEGAAAYVGNARPLVVIRFDDDDVRFEQPLYDAISKALDRRPKAAFDIVAVAPQTADQAQTSLSRAKARRQAGRVLRSLNEMGLPPERVSLAATTSENVEANEIHIYLR